MSDFDATFLLTSRVLVEVRSPEDRKQEKDVASFRGCNQSTHLSSECLFLNNLDFATIRALDLEPVSHVLQNASRRSHTFSGGDNKSPTGTARHCKAIKTR